MSGEGTRGHAQKCSMPAGSSTEQLLACLPLLWASTPLQPLCRRLFILCNAVWMNELCDEAKGNPGEITWATGGKKASTTGQFPPTHRFLHTSRHLHGLFPVHRRQIPCKGRGEWLLRVDDFWRPRSGSQLTETLTSTKEFPMLTGISRKNSVIWKKLVYQYIAFLCFPNRGQKIQVWVPALSLGKQLWPLWASV